MSRYWPTVAQVVFVGVKVVNWRRPVQQMRNVAAPAVLRLNRAARPTRSPQRVGGCVAPGDVGAAAVHVTRSLLTALRGLVEQFEVLTNPVTERLHAYVDAYVFTSLPRAGTIRAARLLAEIGDAGAGS